MKRVLFFLCLLAPLAIFAQTTAPANVTAKFETKFGEVKDIKWHQHFQGYQVFFVKNKTKTNAIFSGNGVWLETNVSVHEDAIDKKVSKALEEKFKVYSFEYITRHDTPEGIWYETSISVDGKTHKVDLDSEGKIRD